MPRQSRNNLFSEFLHIMVQGINREYIFKENSCKEKYLSLIDEKIQDYNIDAISYCIMDNHTHLLLRTLNINEISKFMLRLNTSFAKWYNDKNKRVGYVFRDRYRIEPIMNYGHLCACINYIHNNPVKAKIVDSPEKYKYSSYSQYLEENNSFNAKLLKLLNISQFDFQNLFLNPNNFNVNSFYKIEPKVIIENFLKEKNFQTVKEIKDKKIIKELAILLKEKCNITYKEICELINISRTTLYRILNKI